MKKLVLILSLVFASSSIYAQDQYNVLLFTKTAGFHHVSIHEGVAAIKALGAKHHFNVDWQESSRVFNEKNLERFQVIIFLNTTGDILDDEQQKAMEGFIKSGKGFVGIHAAADTEYDWEWYTQLLGRMFKTHPKIQTAKIRVENKNFPGMENTPASRIWTDEWYQYQDEAITGLNYLITVDEKTYDPVVKRGDNVIEPMGDFHPLAWYHEFDGGRSFYTGMGHVPSTYSDPIFLDQLAGAIWWAATGKGIE
ncbi:MAG: ThuA domain-containing protein [Saprospiraceae bacterium]|nr:ThuA domain-containing protein [Saprospiraceae bacterium]